ncbi:hypothetical protein FNW02_06170 [Komarekiella sp. 'clone 1']|uniref:Uncharacterized protein n=1 Tax=Komarekiella delphini-convector SJRDD-AB1 TaxID=2593771 RepID=A0AA40SUD4_9NOST|nr:DUF6753 family protein [Komarekiella delphini-convector]MBD6615439.1 hypothetical protein [Komarekiella delphini-convector SJRDD-AB1]
MTNIAKVVEKVVAEYSEEKKAEVTDWILKLGVRPDDPLFNLYAELGTTQFALQQLPGRLDSLVVGWTDMVDDKLNSASKVAIQQQKSAIAEAAKELVKMTKQAGGALPHLNLSNWRLAQVAGVLGFVLALGAAIGVFTYKTIAGSVTFQQAASGSAILQPEDKKLLDWAKSNEGKIARSIYVKNAAIIKTCRQQKKYSGGCIIAVD